MNGTKNINEDASSNSSIQVEQLGVWRVFLEKEATWFDLRALWHRWEIAFPTVKKLTIDFHILAPILFPLLCLATLFSQVAPVIMWHLFNRSLFLIEAGLTHGQFDRAAIAYTVGARVAFAALVAMISWWSRKAEFLVQTRIVQHFEGILFEWRSKVDLCKSEDNPKNEQEELINAHTVWYIYQTLLIAVGRAISILWQLYYVATLVHTNKEALIYVILLLVKPFTKDIFQQSIWEKPWIATSTEVNFNRMESIKSIFSNSEYKQEISTNGNIKEYLIQEYRKARHALGDASASFPPAQYSNRERIEFAIVSALLGDLHMFYCFASAILHPSKFTLSKIAMLSKTGDMVTSDFDELVDRLHSVESDLTSVKRIYDLVHTERTLGDGESDMQPSSELGIALAMKNVSFSYPSDANALHDVSFSIKPGQLVVIVGENGSGKSTLVKLLTRLYDCTSGQVIVDGKDIRDYKLASLHSATAILTQDHHIFPLSLSENIGIGNPQAISDVGLIQESARKGRANEFISRRADKYDTVLEPVAKNLMGFYCSGTDDTALTKIYKSFEKGHEISGGERQRVAASRTFMRLTSGTVKLIIADEPSSNLDPQGEWELFKNLMDERQGKTVVFVTHRFGHLTKQADLILCMKNGRLVEQGTHDELMALEGDHGERGEYFKLYEIQARAFT